MSFQRLDTTLDDVHFAGMDLKFQIDRGFNQEYLRISQTNSLKQ